MRCYYKSRNRLASFFKRSSKDDELAQEIQQHVDMVAAEYEAEGLAPDTARKRALKEFGNVEALKEECRDSWGMRLVNDLWTDTKFSFGQLRKEKGINFALFSVLGIGIGTFATVFSVVNTILIKPLPFQDPEELVWIKNLDLQGLSPQSVNADFYMDWRDHSDSFVSMGGYMPFFDYRSYVLENETGQGPERIRIVPITEGFLPTLGVAPILGRNFSTDEYSINGPEAVIIMHDLWKRRFKEDPEIIGTSVWLNGSPIEIVGVMGPSFDFDSIFTPGTEVSMFRPHPLVRNDYKGGPSLAVVGRLKKSMPLEQATANLSVLVDRANELTNYEHGVHTTLLNDRVRGPFRLSFHLLLGAVGCVLAIACMNAANLLLGRSFQRRTEFAIKGAMGASHGRLLRQTVVESLLLAIGGLIVGLPLAYVGTLWVQRLQLLKIPMLQEVSLDATTLVVVGILAMLTSLSCGIIPALFAMKRFQRNTLCGQSQGTTTTHEAGWLMKSLIVAEISFSCALLIAAGLLIKSFEELTRQEMGFNTRNAFVWRIDNGRPFESEEAYTNFYNTLAQQIEELPEVKAAGLTDTLPFGRNRTWGIRSIGQGHDSKKGKPKEAPIFPRIVSPGMLEAMGLSLKAGRFFDQYDTQDSETGIVINEALANWMWKGMNPIGQVATLFHGQNVKIIGVVHDVKHSTLDKISYPVAYFSLQQMGGMVGISQSVQLVVRSELPASSVVEIVQHEIKEYSAFVPRNDYRTLQSIIDETVAPKRLVKNLLSLFSMVALLLAAVGLYGVIAYSAKLRTREIGMRLAIGATKRSIVKLFLKDGIKVTTMGIAIGLGCAFAFSRFLESMLFRVEAANLSIFSGMASMVALVALAASILPIRKTLQTDPMKALRSE